MAYKNLRLNFVNVHWRQVNRFFKLSKIRPLIGTSIKNKQMKINASRETDTVVPTLLA